MSTPEPAALGRLLLESGDTVTQLIESLTGEPLLADVVRQTSRVSMTGDLLEVTPDEPVLERIAVLRGRVSAIRYVSAESVYVPSRLPEPVRRQLVRTADPIGRILVDHGLRLHREVVPAPHEGVPAALNTVPGDAGVVAWWRAYRLSVNEDPVFVIREWFFESVLQAMGRRGRS